jgi:hypothetical protein
MPMPAFFAQPPRQREAVFTGQSDIEQHQCRQLTFNRSAQRDAAVNSSDPKFLSGEIVDQQFALRVLVLDYDNMRAVIHAWAPSHLRGIEGLTGP